MASQTIGEAAAIPPAALALAADNNFPKVVFAGVMEDRFLFRRVGEGGGFGAQLWARRSAARMARRRDSGRRCREGVSTYTACQTLPRRAARRAAVRTSFSLPVLCPIQSRIASRVCQTFSSARRSRQARICSSTRSAVRRRASSRSAIRFPLRKKFSIARSAGRRYRLCPH